MLVFSCSNISRLYYKYFVNITLKGRKATTTVRRELRFKSNSLIPNYPWTYTEKVILYKQNAKMAQTGIILYIAPWLD